MAETVLIRLPSREGTEDPFERTARLRAAAGRCPACGVPQGPFGERRGRTVTCLACHARYDDRGNILIPGDLA